MVDRIRKVVENRSNLGPITLFLGAKTAVLVKMRLDHFSLKVVGNAKGSQIIGRLIEIDI
jgi:hypothetical protein